MKYRVALAMLLILAGCAPGIEQGGPREQGIRPPLSLGRSTGNPAIGGVAMPPTRTIAQNAAAAPELSVLVRAVTTAGLASTLDGPGPYTLFAPTDEAFGRLAPGTVDALLKPENRDALTKLLSLHLVAGTVSGSDLMARIAAAGGRTTLTSVAGEPLIVTLTGKILTLTDSGGNKSYVEIEDIRDSNGVMHVVNGVLVPRLRP